ncbi:hypothetical protein [Kitasatospora sp. NPDC001683]
MKQIRADQLAAGDTVLWNGRQIVVSSVHIGATYVEFRDPETRWYSVGINATVLANRPEPAGR